MPYVPLKEHLEKLLIKSNSRHTLALRHLKELVLERFRAIEKARKLQADEYERRLTVLNHAHEQAVEVQHTYVTQEKYEDYVKQTKSALEIALQRTDEKISALDTSINKDILLLKERVDKNEGRSMGMNAWWTYLMGGVGAIGIIFGIIALFLK